MMTFNHMRQVREEVMVKTYAIKKKNKMWSRSARVLPTLRFSREFALVFLWSCGVFWRLAGCFSFGLFLLIFACSLGFFFADLCFADCFFFNICGTFAVSMYCLKHIGFVFMKIRSFWACFSDLPPCFGSC